MRVSMTVNGALASGEVEPRTLLSDFLRDDLGLTGTKVGCETSQCGACTVLLDGVSVKSCTVLAAQADAATVGTVEGLDTDGRLAPLQQGFFEKHGLQCGFCTAGMLMGMVDLLKRNPDPDEAAMRAWLEGNLCRCTGYQNVLEAVRYAVALIASPVGLVADTPGKQFYERQVTYLLSKDVDKLVADQYHEDGMVVSHEFQVQGHEALRQHFREYLKWVDIQKVLSTDKFTETENTVFFEATVRSNFGIVHVFDVFVLDKGKIRYHFTGVK